MQTVLISFMFEEGMCLHDVYVRGFLEYILVLQAVFVRYICNWRKWPMISEFFTSFCISFNICSQTFIIHQSEACRK
jgi:hypothetical protein